MSDFTVETGGTTYRADRHGRIFSYRGTCSEKNVGAPIKYMNTSPLTAFTRHAQ